MTTAPELPPDRDHLLHLLRVTESAIAATKLFHRWMRQRIDEETRNWEECARQKLPESEVFSKLSKWGITIEGWESRFNELSDEVSVHLEPLRQYLPLNPPLPSQVGELLSATAHMSKLEQRATALEIFNLFAQDINRQRQEVEELKARIAKRLFEPGIDAQEGGQIGIPANDHILPNADDDGSDEAAQPGYLGLVVDEAHGEVRRTGKRYERLGAYFKVDSAEWHTFIVAWKSGDVGATTAAWKNGYPGNWNSTNSRGVKTRVNDKLKNLGVKLQARVPPKLIERKSDVT